MEQASQGVRLVEAERLGEAIFRRLKLVFKPGGEILTEPGAMACQDTGIDLRVETNGGIIKGLIAKFLGKESFFINRFRNDSNKNQELVLSQPTPGEILEMQLDGNEYFLQHGSFIACTPSIERRVVWAGFSSWLAGEGLFRLSVSGRGRVWYGCYGAVIEKEVKGSFIVDSGHLLSYPPTIQLQIKMSGGIFSSFFGGEGLVLKVSGTGKIQLQTRSIQGLASWLNPRFWG